MYPYEKGIRSFFRRVSFLYRKGSFFTYLAIVVAVYYPSLKMFYLPIDDPFLLQGAQAIIGGKASFLQPLPGHRMRPGAGLYYVILYGLFGLNPFPYAVVRLLLTALAAYFVYLYSQHLWEGYFPPFASGLLFAVFYSHYEMTLWMTPSYLYLCLIFFLSTLIFYEQYRKGKRVGYVWPFFMMAAIAFHEEAFSLSILIPIVAFFSKHNKRWVVDSLLAFGLASLYALFSLSTLTPESPSYGIRTLLAFFVPMAEFGANILGGSVLYLPYKEAIAQQTVGKAFFPAMHLLIAIQIILLLMRNRKGSLPRRSLFLGFTIYFLGLAPPILTFGEKYQIGMRYIFISSFGFLLIVGSLLSLFYTYTRHFFWRIFALWMLLTIVLANAVRLRYIQKIYLRSSNELGLLITSSKNCCSLNTQRLVVFTPNAREDERVSGGVTAWMRLYGLHIDRVDFLPLSVLPPSLATCNSGKRKIFCSRK